MKVTEFVRFLEARLEPETFKKVCQMAKDGKMGFGAVSADWGSYNGKKG